MYIHKDVPLCFLVVSGSSYVFSEIYLQTHEVQVIEPLAAVLSSRDPAALLGTTSSDGTCNCMGSDFSHFFRHKCFISDLFEDA